ncbi:MAG TPA: D-glycero-beta-D-manno-heptose 1-phosphate adenylyltransferase [Candidatus Coatesbacteria bacterium]|nr:D-glycero-beta-D-manno-heptose 1-phosphate adenylyltransferase [Candidatus Coatesbacteria bacterium]
MNRVLSAEELLALWGAGGRPPKVVFTNGCFDLLHPGHVRYLAAARELGDFLVVGVNDDASARRLKGPARPFLALAVRAELLAALKPVDCVVPFAEDTPLELIEKLRPDVLVKGGDYSPDQIAGADEVAFRGGRVVVLPLVEDYSSTALALAVADCVGAERGLAEHGACEPYGPGRGEKASELKAARDEKIRRQAPSRPRKKGEE